MSEAYIYEAIRTPRGKNKGGSLHGTKAVDLVVGLIEEIKVRFPDLDYNQIDDIVLGIVTPVGDQGGNLARTAAIASTLPQDVPGFQINRFCASGLEAIALAGQKVKSGWDRFVLAGGVESMSRTSMGFDGGPMYLDPVTNYDAYFVPQGISADLIATIEGFSREDVDSWAVTSQQRAEKSWSSGFFTKSVVPVKDINGVTILDTDEHRRPDTTLEGLGKLNPAFVGIGDFGGFDAVALQKYYTYEKINHVHTGGNSSGIVDGAALVLVGNEKAGKANGLIPRARIVASAAVAEDPTIMLTGPTPATKKVLQTAGLSSKDIDVWEINEAFASVVLKWIKDLNLDPEQVNVNGGAIALGHPLGATGAMLVGTVLDELERTGGKYGLITLCIAAGMGVATIIERL